MHQLSINIDIDINIAIGKCGALQKNVAEAQGALIPILKSLRKPGKSMAPPKRDTTGVLVRLHAHTLNAIDDLISKEDDEPSRPEMIRRLIKSSLTEKGYDLREWID